jgi:hypothetical protein
MIPKKGTSLQPLRIREEDGTFFSAGDIVSHRC